MQDGAGTQGISAAQRKALYALAGKLQMTSGDLHELIRNMTGQESIKTLPRYACARVIDELKRRAGEGKASGYDIQQRPLNRLSAKQEKAIRAIEQELGWKGNPKRMRGWLEKYYGVSAIRFLTPAQASACIVGLKKMIRGKTKEGGGQDER